MQACGDRELLDHEVVGRVAGKSAEFLHVFVRLSDVKSFNVTGTNQAAFEYQQTDRPSPRSSKSALTASLSQRSGAETSSEGSSEG